MENHITQSSIFENGTGKSSLEDILRQGAQQLLGAFVESEIQEYLKRHGHLRDDNGRKAIVKNGHMPEREITTGIGPVAIRQPRVRYRQSDAMTDVEPFTSQILPKYLRRIPSIDNLLPLLYLKGISTGQMKDALVCILGDNAKNVSAGVVSRLKEKWHQEYEAWLKTDFSSLEIVYVWADGIYFQPKMEDPKTCSLVVIGADKDGKKHLLAFTDGYRESKESWATVMRDLKARGLANAPKLAVGDGAMGFWGALREEYPECREQRCWFHKMGNVLDKMPESVSGRAKPMLQEIFLAEKKVDAEKAFDKFIGEFSVKYEKACKCLAGDREVLMAFYDFPAQHWPHIRTTNPIESSFATVRHRTIKTRNTCSRKTLLSMGFKLLIECQKKWRRLRGYKQIPILLKGGVFEDGILKKAA